MSFIPSRSMRPFFEVELFGLSWFFIRIGNKGLSSSPRDGIETDWRKRDDE